MKRSIALLIATLLVLVVCGRPLTCDGAPITHGIRPGAGVSAVRALSDYGPALAGTPGDSPVYILEGKDPGAVVFVAGGTHANEIAGIVAATILVERARPQRGRLIVIPHANNAAVRYDDPKRPEPPSIFIETPGGGRREFLYGVRLTHPDDQGEKDLPKYRHSVSAEELPGAEARNLNRAYPGNPDGNLTQKIAFAIMQLLKDESVDVAFDFHETSADSRLAWMIVANPKNVDVGAAAVLNLDGLDIPMKLDASSNTFRGLSHREWGDGAKTQAFLFETPNPAQAGQDQGRSADTVNDPGFSLARRVGVHLSAFLEILEVFNETVPAEKGSRILAVPGLPEIKASGLGAFLR